MNANLVLANVNAMLKDGEEYRAVMKRSKKWYIRSVCDELGIFDWWNEKLSMTQLKQMKKFLETAIENGFTGYVCFKVGAAGCSHGMWAYKNESTTGYSPNEGEALYHSFRNGENYYDYMNANGEWLSTFEKYEFTLKEVKQAMMA